MARLNAADREAAEGELLDCCGSRAWASAVVARRPFADAGALRDAAEAAFDELADADWEEALAAHPRIGERAGSGEQSPRGEHWSAGEQSGVERSPEVAARLADGNRRYEARFGRSFVVRAAGRSADEMLSALERRLLLDAEGELAEASRQQREITQRRIDRMLAR